MRRLNTILLVLGFGFLLFLVWRMGPAALWHQVTALGWGVLLLVVAEGAANFAHTLGWRHCISKDRAHVCLWPLFRMSMAGWAINNLTPTASVGGEVSRAALLATRTGVAEATGSVLLDKLMTAVAHLALVVLGGLFLFWRVRLPFELWLAMAVTTGLLTAGMTTFLLLQQQGKLGASCRWLVAHRLGGRCVARAAQRLEAVDDALKEFYRRQPGDLVASVAWHMAGHAVALLHVGLFLWLVGQPAPLANVATAGLLCLWFDLLTFAVPLNLGTLEGSRVLALKSLGCQALLGMTFGVAVRSAQLFWACFGLVSYALMVSPRQPTEAQPQPPPLAWPVDLLRKSLGMRDDDH